MAVIFCDGFDHYNRTEVGRKWTYTSAGPEGGPGGGEAFMLGTTWKKTGRASGGVGNSWIKKDLGANYGTLFVGFWEKSGANVASKLCGFYDINTNQINLRRLADGSISIYRGDTLLGSSAESGLVTTAECHIQIKVVFHQTLGSVEVRINNVVKILLTGIDTCSTVNEYCNSFRLEGSYNGLWVYYDDFWIDDSEFLGMAQIYTIYPNGAGVSTDFTPSVGNNYDCLNDEPHNSDTDYVYSSTLNAIDLYTFDNLIPTVGDIKAVQTTLTGRKTDSGNKKLVPIVRYNNINYLDTEMELYDIYMPKRILYTVNPLTNKKWTISQINDLQLGIKLTE